MSDDIHHQKDILQISPAKEKDIWEHFIGLYIDRFIKDDNTIDIDGLRECLKTKLGPLFVQNADQFESVLQTLNDIVDATRAKLIALVCEPLQDLRGKNYPDYPTFESSLRVLNQKQNGFTPLMQNRMVSYQIDGAYVYFHIQPSYSVADKSGTLEEAMRALARKLSTDDLKGIKTVAIDSWMVVDRPQRWEELGFTVSKDRTNFAYASAEKFQQHWLH